ncbi:MAG: hypothetical protein GEU78_02295 [Actinobacteria bacterium]|nr:hypothetical protein [Actinomycetota bacterium]
MTHKSGSDESPDGGLEPRPPRAPRLRYLAAAAFVLVTIVGGAAPAVGSQCDKKPTKAGPAAVCDDKGGKATDAADGESGSGTGNAYGKSNGKASGNAGGHTGTNKGGGGGNDGGATPDPGADGGSRHDDRSRDRSDDSAGATERTRTSPNPRQAQTSTYDDSLRRPSVFPVETTTSRPSVLVDPATEADGDVAGPQLSLELGEMRQPNSAQGELLSTALTTVETMAFPISLALLVGAFLFVQAYIDRNDPKLKQAALKREVYEFD